MRPRWTKWQITIMGIACAVLIPVALFTYFATVPSMSKAQFRVLVPTELPDGTPRVQVERWLRNRGLRFDDIGDRTGPRVGLGGSFRNYRIDPLGDRELDFEFYFDEHNKKIGTYVRQVTYGP